MGSMIFAGAALGGMVAPMRSQARADPIEPLAVKLIAAARSQIGVTRFYDPSYSRISYPNGDVPRERGVCTDVVIRAFRDALQVNLQRHVHEDMKAAFSAYPPNWGLKRPDRNIDHRRVPNLETYFKRKGASLPLVPEPDDLKPGDLVTQRLEGGLPHILIVSDRTDTAGRPLAIHNIGLGAREEDALFNARIVGHFRYFG